jgi:hypothetical protein
MLVTPAVHEPEPLKKQPYTARFAFFPGTVENPEVEHLDRPRAIRAPYDEQVGGLQIAMHDAERVSFGDGLACLQHELHRYLASKTNYYSSRSARCPLL